MDTLSHMELSEQFIQDSFHSYLKSSLTQAKAERLLDVDVLSSAEGDLMITGPALCLYFAALRCTTDPPSVPLPRSAKNSRSMELSYENCPPPFVSFLRVWADTVPSIQSLVPEAQHDLARVICGLQPLQEEANWRGTINGIAADLRAVAIEISQRRSFQDRYASDLQAALDAGADPDSPSPRRASFVPPPVYDPSSSVSPDVSPRASMEPSRPADVKPRDTLTTPLPSPALLAPPIPHPTSAPGSSLPPRSPSQSLSPSPSLFRQDSPAIEFIRETLYASLADILEREFSLRALLKRDPSRAYFASVSLAILDVSLDSITPDGSVIGILGKRLTINECPHPLRPFMVELGVIGREAKAMDEEDNENAMKLVQQGREDDIPLSRLDRVRMMLEKGVGYDSERDGRDGDGDGSRGRRSVEGRAVAFANKVNSLGLSLTKLKPFKERQEYVFKILGGIGS
ncbi:hypothetical protein BYT27DRAFT_7167197 [Phlegmacium glaucopus]|nr:hypothetical protein BYT27DRAFT_7167197 [Phlegmacium glaucopus]